MNLGITSLSCRVWKNFIFILKITFKSAFRPFYVNIKLQIMQMLKNRGKEHAQINIQCRIRISSSGADVKDPCLKSQLVLWLLSYIKPQDDRHLFNVYHLISNSPIISCWGSVDVWHCLSRKPCSISSRSQQHWSHLPGVRGPTAKPISPSIGLTVARAVSRTAIGCADRIKSVSVWAAVWNAKIFLCTFNFQFICPLTEMRCEWLFSAECFRVEEL